MNALQYIQATVEPGNHTRDPKAIRAYLQAQGFNVSQDAYAITAHWSRGRVDMVTVFFYLEPDRDTAVFVLGWRTKLVPDNLTELKTAVTKAKACIAHAVSGDPVDGADYLTRELGIEHMWHPRLVEALEKLR